MVENNLSQKPWLRWFKHSHKKDKPSVLPSSPSGWSHNLSLLPSCLNSAPVDRPSMPELPIRAMTTQVESEDDLCFLPEKSYMKLTMKQSVPTKWSYHPQTRMQPYLVKPVNWCRLRQAVKDYPLSLLNPLKGRKKETWAQFLHILQWIQPNSVCMKRVNITCVRGNSIC